jgi:hypothetical protein
MQRDEDRRELTSFSAFHRTLRAALHPVGVAFGQVGRQVGFE